MAPPIPSGDAREFPARFDALADTARFARSFCDAHGIPRETAMRLRLIIEELFTNSIRHGYRSESGAPIRIELAVIEGCPAVTYEDSAPAYDPLARLSASASGDVATLDSPSSDGLGLLLIGNLTCGGRHSYQDGRNRVWLVMRP